MLPGDTCLLSTMSAHGFHRDKHTPRKTGSLGPSIPYSQPAEGESRNRFCQAESWVSHLVLGTRHLRLDEKIKKETSSSS